MRVSTKGTQINTKQVVLHLCRVIEDEIDQQLTIYSTTLTKITVTEEFDSIELLNSINQEPYASTYYLPELEETVQDLKRKI